MLQNVCFLYISHRLKHDIKTWLNLQFTDLYGELKRSKGFWTSALNSGDLNPGFWIKNVLIMDYTCCQELFYAVLFGLIDGRMRASKKV